MAVLSKAPSKGGGTTMNVLLLQQVAERSTNTWVGIVVPGLIFIIAFSVTLLLYRHFSKTHHGEES